MRFILSAFIVLLATLSAHAHEWSDASGQYKIQAKLTGVANGQVQLLKPDKQTLTVPIEKLSQADQKRVQAWLDTRDGTAPKLPANSALLFDFRVRAANGRTATLPDVPGFAIEYANAPRPVLMTLTWAFASPALGIEFDKLHQHVTGLAVKDAANRKAIGKGNDTLRIKGGKAATQADASHDMVAFLLDNKSRVGALKLADSAPDAGEQVWLLKLPQPSGELSEAKPDLIPCKVESQGEKTITFITPDGEVPPNSISSPFVNYAGEVVGMFTMRGGRKGTVIGMRVEDIRTKLKAATDK